MLSSILQVGLLDEPEVNEESFVRISPNTIFEIISMKVI